MCVNPRFAQFARPSRSAAKPITERSIYISTTGFAAKEGRMEADIVAFNHYFRCFECSGAL